MKPMTVEEYGSITNCWGPIHYEFTRASVDRIALALREREQLRCFVVEVRNSMKMRLEEGMVPRTVDKGLLDEANRLLKGADDAPPLPRD